MAENIFIRYDRPTGNFYRDVKDETGRLLKSEMAFVSRMTEPELAQASQQVNDYLNELRISQDKNSEDIKFLNSLMTDPKWKEKLSAYWNIPTVHFMFKSVSDIIADKQKEADALQKTIDTLTVTINDISNRIGVLSGVLEAAPPVVIAPAVPITAAEIARQKAIVVRPEVPAPAEPFALYSAAELAAMKVILNNKTYQNYWKRLDTIKKLTAANDKQSAMLLAPLLSDIEAEIREAAMLALSSFTDQSAMEFLISSALVNPTSALQRSNAAWVIGNTGNSLLLTPLLNALKKESDPSVIARMIESISWLPNATAANTGINNYLRHSSPDVRAAAVKALEYLGATEFSVDILKLLNDSALKVRVAVLDAITKLNPAEAIKYLTARLTDKAPEMRIAALENLAISGADQQTIDQSITAAAQDDNKAVRATANLLRKEKPAPRPGETIPVFFNAYLRGKNIAFLIDFSGSMKDTAIDSQGRTRTKVDIALEELAKTVQQIPEGTGINLIAISTEVKGTERKAFRSVQPATAATKAQLIAYAKRIWARLSSLTRGRGDHYDAMLEAFADPAVDNIVLLSDGVPTAGTHVNPEIILDEINKLNRFRKIVIDTVVTGQEKTNRSFMQSLSTMSNGTATTFTTTGRPGVAPAKTAAGKPVLTREQELYKLNKDQQTAMLIGMGVDKRDVPKTEENRVALIILLEGGGQAPAGEQPAAPTAPPKKTGYQSRYKPG